MLIAVNKLNNDLTLYCDKNPQPVECGKGLLIYLARCTGIMLA